MLPILASLTPCFAQAGPEPEPQTEPPLAIPATSTPPPPPVQEVQVVDERPLAVPGTGAPQLGGSREIREYRSRYLAVRHLSEVVHGTTVSYGWGGWGSPYWGWRGGWGAWPHSWAYRVDSWGVFKGEQRLDVPNTLAALGDVAGRQALDRRIRSNRTSAAVLSGIGVVGIASSIVGLIGVDQAVTWDDRRDWSNVSLGGLGLMVGGFVGASFPSGKARRLQFVPEETFDISELERRVGDHNERLARELGLDPDRAVQLER